jgi:hypothetical protein
MAQSRISRRWRRNDSGQTLFLVVGGMVMLLGVSALAIDLVACYVARSEAQRAADAAALAGAQVLALGCTSAAGGCVAGGSQEAPATQKAVDTANQNLVAGQAPTSSTVSTSFNYPTPQEPQITVTVYRDGAHSNAMPTFFGEVFGINTLDVSAKATAEAFNPSGSASPIGSQCLKPWILPNCDADHTGGQNMNCPTVAAFIDPTSGAIINAGAFPAGVVGETLIVKPGTPGCAPTPSQYYPVDLPPSPVEPSICPLPSAVSCSSLKGGGGGSLYRQNIACCNANQFVCGPVPVNFDNGNMQGPTAQGVQCLIHEDHSGSGQDILASASPLSITGGSNRPDGLSGVTGLTTSESIVTVPLYDGSDLCPGNACGPSVTIVGFLQVFINSVDLSDVGSGCNQNAPNL